MNKDDAKNDTPKPIWVGAQREARRALQAICLMCGLEGFPRQADYAVMHTLVDNTADLDKATLTAAEYVWDHLLGEPGCVDPEQLAQTYKKFKAVFEAE